MIPVFPAYAVFDSDPSQFERQNLPALHRTTFDDGYARQAPRTTRVRRTSTVRYRVCSLDDRKAFDEWWRKELAAGSKHFHWPDPLCHGEIRRARIVGGDVRYRPYTRFFDNWLIEFDIEVWH